MILTLRAARSAATPAVLVMTAVSLLATRGLAAQTAQERIRADVRYLADDAREGRGLGTAGLDSAAAYVAAQFRQIGLRPAGTDGYFQPFRVDSTAPALAHSGIGAVNVKNVVGLVPGRGSLARQVVVLGAHYDHLGLGGMGSLDPDSTGVVHNGADDNASGTAALIEAARILAGRSAPEQRAIVFVAFTAEESGLLGSDYYVKNPVDPIDSTYAMINFDMVGRIKGDTVITIGTGSASELPMLLDSVNAGASLTLRPQPDPWGGGDHSSFYAATIPVVHLFTDTHSDYHRTTDDWEKIDVEGIERISRYAADLAWAFVTRRDWLTFVNVPQPQQVASGGRGAYLGTIPDMSGSPGGVRLTGVRAGSPADSAGLRAGDVLIQLGEHEVKDLYDMTDALRAHAPGDVVTIVVMRDGQRLELTATLGTRGG